MAISPEGYPSFDPEESEHTVGTTCEMHCETCERETFHTLGPHGEWECEYFAMHAAAQASLEEYVFESILEAFRRKVGPHNVARREREIATRVAGMAENHVEDVMEAES